MNTKINFDVFFVVSVLLFGYNFGDDCTPKCGVRPNTLQRVLGGDENIDSSWPWVFELKAENPCSTHYCTSQLIASNFALTSAHCLFYDFYACKNSNKTNFVEHSPEEITLLKNNDIYKIKKFYYPEKFEENSNGFKMFPFDVAILELEEDVENEPVCVAKLFNPYSARMHSEQLVGYGLHDPFTNENSHKLRAAPVQLYEAGVGVIGARCRAEWGLLARLCGAAENKGALKGDSGTGIFVNHNNGKHFFTHGVMSAYKGGSPSRHLIPDVYTPISEFCDWIQDKTGNKVKCINPYVKDPSCYRKYKNDQEENNF